MLCRFGLVSFFPAARTLELAEGLAEGPPYKGYKYNFEEGFLGSSIVQTTNKDEVHATSVGATGAKRSVRHRRRSVGGRRGGR